jgi:Mn2+/Fe2+ NRAMP family transporter
MDERPRQATKFYGVIAAGMLLGMALQHVGVGGFRLLFWAAVVNGLLAPPLIVLILLVCNNRSVMGEHVNGRWLNGLGFMTAIVMSAAAVAVLAAW